MLVWSSEVGQVRPPSGSPGSANGRHAGKPSGAQRKTLRLELAGQTCAYCPAPATTWDHFIPRSKGGRLTPDNRKPACEPCNVKKADRDPDDWLRILAGPVHTSTLIKIQGGRRPSCPLCGWIAHGMTGRERRDVRLRRTGVLELAGAVRVQQWSSSGTWCPECGFELVTRQQAHTRSAE
jgi:hypothetical protein